MGSRALIAALVFAWAASAWAGDVTGELRLADASASAGPVVVYLTGFTQPPPSDTPTIAQRNKTFLPGLVVVVAGQSVRFTNEDPVLHNVFSTSKARPFDLGKPAPGEAREVRFPTPGVIDVFCNIHESMSATILVLPNRAFAVVSAPGHFVIHGAPAGRYSLFAWGPRVLPFQTSVEISDARPATVSIALTPRVLLPGHLDKFGRPYRDHGGYSP